MSKNYKDYCEWEREKKRNPRLELPERLNKLHIIVSFSTAYSNFGDIFSIDFNDWWAKKKKFFLTNKPSKSVRNFVDLLPAAFDNVIESFKWTKGREPSLGEFRENLLFHFKDSYKRVIISVDLRAKEPAEDLIREFGKLIRRLKLKSKSDLRRWQWKFPTTMKRIEEVERYLETYKMNLEGYEPSEIARQMEYYVVIGAASHRLIQSHIRKAQNILRNAEMGIFPGKY